MPSPGPPISSAPKGSTAGTHQGREVEITIKAPATVPAGTYPGTFGGIEAKESQRDHNPYLRWTLTVLTHEGLKDVSGVSSTATGPKSKSYRWFAGLLGRKPAPDERINVDSLIGRPCTVVLEENEDGFSNVVEILPPPRLSETTVQAYVAEADLGAAAMAASGADDLPF